jgi:hypothetical protein
MNLIQNKYSRTQREPAIKRLGSGPRAINLHINQNSSIKEIDAVVRRRISEVINNSDNKRVIQE